MFSPQLRKTAHNLLKIQTHVYAIFDRRKYALPNLHHSDRVEGQGPFDFRERRESRCKARRAGVALAANARSLCYSDRVEGQGPFDLGSGAKLTEVETSYTGQYLRPMLEKGK